MFNKKLKLPPAVRLLLPPIGTPPSQLAEHLLELVQDGSTWKKIIPPVPHPLSWPLIIKLSHLRMRDRWIYFNWSWDYTVSPLCSVQDWFWMFSFIFCTIIPWYSQIRKRNIPYVFVQCRVNSVGPPVLCIIHISCRPNSPLYILTIYEQKMFLK